MSRRVLVLVAALVAVLCTGCASLPVSGPVYRQAAEASDAPNDVPYFTPPGPARDGSQAAIVSGFLVAMKANPLTLRVAREFLTERARTAWKATRGTIVYENFTVQPGDQRAIVRLSDPRRLDERGGWVGGAPGSATNLDLGVVRENGQWRIDAPPDALVVPTSYFERSFSRFDLYFYDQTSRVLLPDPVFIPQGEQAATSLVRALLGGPSRTLRDVSGTAFPPRTSLEQPVVVSPKSGDAEVPLSADILSASPNELARAADQLAWTLRQVPGISRVRMTVNGAAVPLPGGGTDVPVSSGEQLDAAGISSDMQLWGLSGGRVVDLESSSGKPAPGPLGEPGYSMRSLAVSDVPRRVAAVSGSGTSMFVAAADSSRGTAVERPFKDAQDLLRPSYDMFGQLWAVDRRSSGAVVYVVRGRRAQPIKVPGVTGQDVTAFSIARDGSRMAFTLGDSASVRVADVQRSPDGQVREVAPARSVSAGLTTGARLLDVGWRDPSTIAVLARTGPETQEVSYLSADGSPVSPALGDPAVFRLGAVALVVAPDGDLPLAVVTADQRLYTLGSTGQWARADSKVLQATYGE